MNMSNHVAKPRLNEKEFFCNLSYKRLKKRTMSQFFKSKGYDDYRTNKAIAERMVERQTFNKRT
jgi:hypothetical protein